MGRRDKYTRVVLGDVFVWGSQGNALDAEASKEEITRQHLPNARFTVRPVFLSATFRLSLGLLESWARPQHFSWLLVRLLLFQDTPFEAVRKEQGPVT